MIKIDDIPAICWNLRWLAMKKEPDFSLWSKQISKQTKNTIKPKRALQLLDGEIPSEAELLVLVEQFGLDKETLLSGKLFESEKELLKQNVQFLIDSLPKGENQKWGEVLGVHPQQLSRWSAGEINPQPKNLKKLLRLHGLDPETDLKTVALFLQQEDISSFKKKEWVLKRLERMNPTEVAKIFIALKRMLSPNAKD